MKLVKMKVDILPKNISKNEVICPEWSMSLVDNNGTEKFIQLELLKPLKTCLRSLILASNIQEY